MPVTTDSGSKPAKNFDHTLMRVVGNLLSGAPGSWLGVSPDFRKSTVQDAVETARLIAEEVQKLTVL
jgi:hypothetical protein